MHYFKKTNSGLRFVNVVKGVFFTTVFAIIHSGLPAQGSDPAAASTQVADQTGKDAKNAEKTYDLSALPADLRAKVEKYLAEQKTLNVEIERMDAMVKAASNPWAQQRATGMATKLNHELKKQRVLRRDIVRDYRKLVKSGWEPPESMSFDNLLVNRDKKKPPTKTAQNE